MKVSSVVLAGFVVLTVALASKTYQLGQELTEGLTAASLEVNEAEEIRRGLLDRIHVLKTPPFSLAGTEATLGQEVTYDAVDSMVLQPPSAAGMPSEAVSVHADAARLTAEIERSTLKLARPLQQWEFVVLTW